MNQNDNAAINFSTSQNSGHKSVNRSTFQIQFFQKIAVLLLFSNQFLREQSLTVTNKKSKKLKKFQIQICKNNQLQNSKTISKHH
jgi:hypothetical protein